MKLRIYLTLLLLAMATVPFAEPGKDKAAVPDGADTLKVILSSELEGRNRVIRLKDPLVADTLLRLKAPADRERFDRLLTDPALAAEVKTAEEFRAWWKHAEAEEGIRDLRAQLAAHDVDRGRIPRVYLFDSSVVVYPGWVIVRKRGPGKPSRR
jgi:hypothetical protein